MATQRKRRDSASPPARRSRSASRRSRKAAGLARIAGAVERLLSNVKRLILALGAIAGAIAALIALFPGKGQVATPVPALPPLSNVRTYPDMTLKQYEGFIAQQEAGGARAEGRSASASVPYRLAAYVAGASDGTGEGEASPAQESGRTDTTGTTPTSTTTTTTAEETPHGEPGASGEKEKGKAVAPRAAGKKGRSGVRRPPHRGGGSEAGQPLLKVVQGSGVPPAKTNAVVKALGGLRVSVPVPRPGVGTGAPARGASGGATRGGGSSGSEGAATEGAGGVETGESLSGEAAVAPRQEVEISLPSKCTSTCGASPLLERASIYNHDSAKAARAVAAMFAETRGRVSKGKLYPIGTTVRCIVRLDQFAGPTVALAWSVLSRTDNRRLPQRWLQRVTVKSFRRPFGAAVVPIWFWVPMPLKHAGYVIRIELGDGQRLAEAESETLE